MSFSGDLLYYWTFQDIDATYDYKIEIYKASYSGASTEITSGSILPPLVDIYRGSKSNLFQIIYPREIEFGFYVDKDNLATYDPLLEATYQQYLVKAYRDATQIFTGYMNPEDNNRQLTGKKYEYRMTASDLILDLKDTDYLDYSVLTTGLPYTDSTNILTVLKRCLAFTGVEIDFFVQLNTYETVTSTTTECALEQMTVDNRRFSKDNDGEIKAWKCAKVIEELLRPFHCNLAQVNNKWQIVNSQEYNSKYYEYDWATLTLQNAPNTTRDLSTTIETANTKFVGKPFLYKISPIGKLRIKYLNINVGESEILNGDFSSGLTGWNNGAGDEEWPNFADGGGYLRTQIVGPAAAFSGDKVFYRDSFEIADFTEGDVFSISWKCKLVEVTLTGGAPDIYNPYIACAIKYPSGDILVDVFQASTAEGANYTLYNNIGPLPINATGTHYLYFYVRTSLDATVDSMDYNWDDVVITGIKQGTLRTTDTLYIYDSDIDSKREEEFDVYFLDAGRATDIGRLIDDSTLSSSWSRYGKGETLSLVKTYAQQILNNFGAYKNYVKGAIFDIGDNLHFFSVPIYDSEYYRFINYRKDLRARQIEFELDEVLNADVGYTQLVQTLTSIDGKPTNTATVNVYSVAGSSLWVASGSNIYYNAGNVSIGTASAGARLDISSGAIALLVGADSGAITRTNTTDKIYRIGAFHYTNAEEPMALLVGSSTTSANTVSIGGSTTSFNAATQINFYTAANNTTVTGTLRGGIDSSGAFSLTGLTASRALATGASKELVSSATTATELGYVNGVTSAIQAQFTGKISHSLSTAANDILVGSGSNTYIKKTQAEGKVILNYWTLATNDLYYTTGNVGIGTSTPGARLDLSSGIIALLVGADSGAITRTNVTDKIYRVGAFHYTNAEEPMALLVGSSTSSANNIIIGGGTSTFNAATNIQFYTAANNTTTTGTSRATIDSSGNFIVAGLTASRAVATGASKELVSSATTATELALLNGLTALAGGTYTPTLTGVQNVNALTAKVTRYIRINNVVYVMGIAYCDATATGLVRFGISLPIASDLSNVLPYNELTGLLSRTNSADFNPGLIYEDTTNDRAQAEFNTDHTDNTLVSFSFSYVVA